MIERIRTYLAARKDRTTAGRLARTAHLWLEDETLNTALAVIRQKAMQTWANSPDLETQRECWRMIQSTNSLVGALRALQTQGKFDEAEAKRALAEHPPKE